MKAILGLRLLLLMLLLAGTLSVDAQFVQLGSGTTDNGITTASPVNIWFRRTTARFVYTQSELIAAGAPATGGTLNQMGFIITGLPVYNLPDYQIRVKHTTQTNVATDPGNTGWTTVKNGFTYSPSIGGYDMIVFDNGFNWDGVSNLAVEICFSQVQPTFDPSGQCRVYSATSGFRYTRSDAAGGCFTTVSTLLNTKPQVQFVFELESIWTGAVNNDWNNDNNWSIGAPNEQLDARIPSGLTNYPSISSTNASCNNLFIETDASLTLVDAFAINVYGNWENEGTFTPNAGEVIFRGPSLNEIRTNGAGEFYDLEINSAGGASIINGTYTVTNQMQVLLGDFNTNGAITLTSTPSRTARIDEVPGYCDYTLTMNDSWTDGWNGGFLTLYVDGVAQGDFACLAASTTVTIPVINGLSFELEYTAGIFENENTYTLTDPSGTVIFSDGPTPATGVVFTSTGSCSFNNPINGNITTQRYIDAGGTYWRNFCSPVDGAAYSQFNDDFTTSGYLGSSYPNWPSAADPFNSVVFYDETVAGTLDNGYTAPTNATNNMLTTRGLLVWCGDNSSTTSAFTWDLTGGANAGDYDLGVSYTTSAGTNDDGWNLVANPFMSAIDWTVATGVGWDKANLEDAVYVLDPDLAGYASWIAGASTNGGSPIIASSQSFWVKARAANPDLHIYEQAKSSTDQSFFKASGASYSPGMSIKLTSGGGATDEMVVRTLQGGTAAFDAAFDARKLQSDAPGQPDLLSIDGNGDTYSILSTGIPTTDEVIPLYMQYGTLGANLTITVERREELIASCLILKDLETNTSIDLNVDTVYSFVVSDTMLHQRFELILGADLSSTANVADISCFGETDGTLTVQGFGVGPWDYIWEDVNGNVLQSELQSTSASTLDNLPSGQYAVTVTNNGNACATRYFETQLIEPQALGLNGQITNEAFGWDGAVQLAVTGGTPPFIFDWDNGSQSQHLQDVEGGVYEVTVTDAHGCEITESFTVGSTVSVEEHHSELEVTVYPNPNNGTFFLQMANPLDGLAEVQIIDMRGQLVMRESINVQGTQQLNISPVADGIYFIIVTAGDQQFKGKLNVQR